MHTTEADLFSWAKEANQKKRTRRRPQQNGFARALALVVEYGRRAELMKQASRATCPRCGNDGPVHEHFGTRRVNGEVRRQSWCRNCRAQASRSRRARPDLSGALEFEFELGSAA